MNLSVCTITFRHQLISIAEIAKWSVANGFQGIELWGAHATNLEDQPEYGKEWLSSYALKTSMLSDCLLYTSPSPRDATLSRMPASA